MSVADERKFQKALKRYVDTKQGDLKTFRPMRVESREEDGTVMYRPLDGECVTRGPGGPVYPGELIDSLPSPPLNLSGAAGVSLAATARVAATVYVESVEPHIYRRGQSYTDVVVTGGGFLETFALEFIEPGSADEINADITVDAIRVVDEETVHLDLTIAPGAGLIDVDILSGIRFDNVGAPI